jgi:lipoate-protein ligase A
MIGGRKLVGSAQLRRRGVVLQHGALPLGGDVSGIARVLRLRPEQRIRLATRLARASTTLTRAVGRKLGVDDVVAHLAAGFAEALNLDLVQGELTAWEQQQAGWLHTEKYASLHYTLQR